MPPKKNVESKTPAVPKKPRERKPAKPRIKQVKPKLRTPTVIKLKIPVASLSNNSTIMYPKVSEIKTETSPKLTKKQATLVKKLELANEVAAAQLGNKHTLLQPEKAVIDPPKRARGRRKKIQESSETLQSTEPTSTPSASAATDSEDAFDVTPKKRKYVRKPPTKAVAKKPEKLSAEAVNTTAGTNSPPTPKKKKIKQTKLTDAITGITKTPKLRPKKSPNALTTECKTRKRKMKPESGKTVKETEVLQSPSILDQVEDLKKKEKLEPSELSDPNIEPCSIDSRKTSLTSECLSWTKDISSSSTTTCLTVCSTDFVRIDKKMPVIKLTPTTSHLKQDSGLNNNNGINIDTIESSSSDSESTESEQSSHRESHRELTPEMESRSLHLSTSSITPEKSDPVTFPANSRQNNEEFDKISYCIDKLTSKLQHFDLEIINWIGYDNEEIDVNTIKFQDNIFKMLKEESEVITHCRLLRKILSDNVDEVDANDKSAETLAKESDSKDVDTSGDVDANNRSPKQVTSDDNENNFTSDKVRYIPFDQSCDDDDALSLFAESLTGIESSRRNSSAASLCTNGDFEEYVPHPVNSEKWEPAKRISYPPPSFAEKANDAKAKTVCEKQNADSTSIYKETEPYKATVPFQKNDLPSLNANASVPANKKRPCLMSYLFKPLSGVKSGVFRGICFFNMLASCKNVNCRFPHIIPTHDEITDKLVRLSEEMFIQEYMLMRSWPTLRRQYGMCFVHECLRRDLTRIAVEMALDFIMKANESCRDDMILKVVVTECVLLHLNNVNLETCEDLLTYKHQRELLCEIFMQVIANTQNFSRFKPVFINLTKFILAQGRTFSLHVATQILERVCILPCEPLLLEALLEIVKNTDRAILNNTMLGHFENQLSVASKQCYEELLALKKDASMNRPVLQNLYISSPKAIPEPVIANQLVGVCEREKRYTSPDTTNLDTMVMNKSTDEPIITRTIDFGRAQLFESTVPRNFTHSNSSSNDSSEDFRPKMVANPKFKNWRDRSIFNSIRGLSPGPRHGTPRPLNKRHIHQQLNFGPGPSKFLRRSGPDFF